MKSFIKDVFSVGLSKVAIIVFGLATSILTARYLGPEGNGIIAALLVYPSLFMNFGSLGIQQSTTYFLGKNIYSEREIKTAITQIWFLTTLVSIITCFLLIRYFSNFGSDLLLVFLVLAPIPFTLFNKYNSGIFLGKNDIQTFNRINWIPTLVTLLGTIVFIVLLKLEVAGALMALILGPIVISLILLLKNKFIRAFSLTYDIKIIKSMLSLGIVYALALLIINLNYKVDIILLDKLSNAYELGIYSKGSGITEFLWQIPMIFSTIIFARSAVSNNPKAFSIKITQLLRVSLLIIGMASIVLIFFSRFIITTLYGDDFYGSAMVLNYLMPGVLIMTFYKVMNTDLAGRGKPWISMKAMIPALTINIILNILFIPDYGANGAAIASTISYTVAGFLFLFFYSKETQIPVKDILRYKKTDFDPIIKLLKIRKK